MRRIGLAVVLTVVSFTLAPLAVEAQEVAKVWRIGLLGTHSYSAHAKGVEALRSGLRDLGYVEGKNIVILGMSVKIVSASSVRHGVLVGDLGKVA